MDQRPLFTVIIPAKDRADYLRHTLRTCAAQEYENLEVIVCDDGSTDHTREVVESAGRADRRIRYASPGANVGMRENFEFALRQAKPGFVIALGADDGLMPHGIAGMHRVLQETGQEMLAWPAPVYTYAGARTGSSQLLLYRQSGQRLIHSNDFLRRQAENLHYLSDIESPMFYVKGVVSTRLIEQVRSRSPEGRFYCCPTPDGYSGIVLAGEVQTYAYSGTPFSIYGVSPSSQGMNYMAADEKAKQLSETFFKNVAKAPMHAQLGSQAYSPLISLMTADYLLTAGDLPGWPGRFPALDFARLLIKSLDELAHGLYSEARMGRELNILAGVAECHGLGSFFRDKVRQARKFAKKDPLAGNGFSPKQIFLDGTAFGLHDIFDAAYFAYCAHAMVPKLSLVTAARALQNSVRYRLQSMRRGGRFPEESHWRTDNPVDQR